jgi:hypothetical protein
MSRLEEPMRTLITILSIAMLAAGCDSQLHAPDEGGGESPATDPIDFDVPAVVVANDSTQPVPVSAAQSGDWNVAVNGPVDVTGAVAIANSDDAESIPVRIVSGEAAAQAAQIPWVGGGQIFVPSGRTWANNQFYTPPIGKRLVLEYVAIEFETQLGQYAPPATILASDATNGTLVRLPLQPTTSPTSGRPAFAVSQMVKLNVGHGLVVTVQRTGSTGTALATVSLSGYLVDT